MGTGGHVSDSEEYLEVLQEIRERVVTAISGCENDEAVPGLVRQTIG